MGFRKTQRQYKDIDDNCLFHLFMNQETSEYKLISHGDENTPKGTEVNGFYICVFTGVTIKINSKKIVTIPIDFFYNIKENEKITHKKFIGFGNFKKV